MYFYNANSGGAPSWSLDDRSQDGTNDWFRGGWIEPPNSGGPPLGTRNWEEAGTIKMKSVRHRNISAETETRHDQHLHDPVKAAEFASALGLMVGGAGHPFVGDWGVKGLYAYRSGKYKGIAYFGTGGSESDRLKDTYNPEKHGESQQKYRPWNRDDPKIPEDIRQKLIRLEDKNSTRMNQTSQPSSSGTLQGEIALKSVHGKYLSATPEGRVEWDDDVAQVGEYFRVEQRKNGKIALRSAFDMYVSAQSDGNVECNRREAPPGGWEEFTVEYRSNDVVCLKSCHGKYLSAQPDGTAQWNRDHAPRSGWEEIRIEQYRNTSEPIWSEAILNSDQKYVFAPEHKGWHWHNDRARAMGGHIASITSAEENEHITQISGGAPVWLGGIRKGARYRGKHIADRKGAEIGEVGPGAEDWYWSDGRPWSYTNWGPGEPNNWDAGENRVQHLGKFDAVWNDVGEDWEGPAVYLVPNIASATSKSTSPEIDILAKFKSRLDISDASDDFFTTDDYFDDLSSKFNKK